MSQLDEELQRLSEWLAAQGKLPSLNRHVLTEGVYIEADGTGGFCLVVPSDPSTPVESSVRLEKLLEFGPGSLSIKAVGVSQDRLVLSVDCQAPGLSVVMTDVSINFGRPSCIASDTHDSDREPL